MCKIQMSEEILNVINAVVDYKRYICSHNRLLPKEGFDWFVETEAYYYTLPLPDGLSHNRFDFEKILGYLEGVTLEQLNNTESHDLYDNYF